MTGPKRTILVVEDDTAVRRGLVDALQFQGYAVVEARDGRTGLDMALHRRYDLMLLDLMLPGNDGLDILKQVRPSRPTLPVIILTARGQEDDRIKGLSLGADDYVVKPFSVREVLARVEAVLRRSPERPSDLTIVPLPGGKANLARREVAFDDGGRVALSENEVALLRYLACNAGRAVSREEILSHVWGLVPHGIETRTIDMHIARLRAKLRDDRHRPEIILTVRGKGYEFAGPE